MFFKILILFFINTNPAVLYFSFLQLLKYIINRNSCLMPAYLAIYEISKFESDKNQLWPHWVSGGITKYSFCYLFCTHEYSTVFIFLLFYRPCYMLLVLKPVRRILSYVHPVISDTNVLPCPAAKLSGIISLGLSLFLLAWQWIPVFLFSQHAHRMCIVFFSLCELLSRFLHYTFHVTTSLQLMFL